MTPAEFAAKSATIKPLGDMVAVPAQIPKPVALQPIVVFANDVEGNGVQFTAKRIDAINALVLAVGNAQAFKATAAWKTANWVPIQTALAAVLKD